MSFELTNLNAVNWLQIDETRYSEEPSAVDAARKGAYHVHISVT